MTKHLSSAGHAATRVSGSEFRAFITRLHFYVGLFVGPFILVAALTGTLFVLTPQIETLIYADQLRAQTQGEPRSLADQAQAARSYIGQGPRLFAMRPAPKAGATTRVMFSQPGLGDSESRAIFVDPVSLRIQGDLIVYGTSGNLPLRTTIDYLHRHLLLGEIGRVYSELAASWLWIAALGGVLLWSWQSNQAARTGVGRLRRLHSTTGIWLAVGLVFLSITGLTWSKWAGDHIDQARGYLGWTTPSVTTKLTGVSSGTGSSEHASHGTHDPGVSPIAGDPSILLDDIQFVARQGGIDSPFIEIRPAKAADQAWLVREYDRSWPTQVDTIAIDPSTLSVVSRADFETFPLIAKLIRWGIDAHMGVLFGLPNQLLLAATGFVLTTMIALGYAMWWKRRPSAGVMPKTLIAAWVRLSPAIKVATVAVAIGLGWALPLMGVSTLAFIVVDALRWKIALSMWDAQQSLI
ncbi:PepSY-associated TM helix domain-containing protein [Flaviflagellibacter deserti]|uniref:PepSY-associated TM helix domain-containing protein n=1 Tax=Flaviflagellibacter deserti TaxID=2267266 RepID=A0ABV9Z2F6_9HYPH